MEKKAIILCILFIVFNNICVNGYGESDPSGHPNYLERINLVFINSARIAPEQYKAIYMANFPHDTSKIFSSSSFSPVAPLYFDSTLTKESYALSEYMAKENCVSVESCNETLSFVSPCSENVGENVIVGIADPLISLNQLLCGKAIGVCAEDGSEDATTRDNIMEESYSAIGISYSASAQNPYWSQFFADEGCDTHLSPVYSASHYIQSGITKFIAVYYSSPAIAPSTAFVNIDGIDYPLSLEIGTEGAGTYVYTQDSRNECRPYYFTFGTTRYPDTGYLMTFGEGECTASFSPLPSLSSLSLSSPSSSHLITRGYSPYSPYSAPFSFSYSAFSPFNIFSIFRKGGKAKKYSPSSPSKPFWKDWKFWVWVLSEAYDAYKEYFPASPPSPASPPK